MKTLTESYTIPRQEQERLKYIQEKFDSIEPSLKKSEIVRIGIYNVERLSEEKVRKILDKDLGRLAVGKPSKELPNEEITDAEITVNDNQWKEVTKNLPKSNNSEGRPQIDYRNVINGILFIFRFDKQRRDIPSSYGSFATCRRRLKEWRSNDQWQKICRSLIRRSSQKERKNLESVLLRTCLAKIS